MSAGQSLPSTTRPAPSRDHGLRAGQRVHIDPRFVHRFQACGKVDAGGLKRRLVIGHGESHMTVLVPADLRTDSRPFAFEQCDSFLRIPARVDVDFRHWAFEPSPCMAAAPRDFHAHDRTLPCDRYFTPIPARPPWRAGMRRHGHVTVAFACAKERYSGSQRSNRVSRNFLNDYCDDTPWRRRRSRREKKNAQRRRSSGRSARPLRRIRPQTDVVPGSMPDAMYVEGSRPAVTPERLWNASLLITLCPIRPDRLFCGRLDYDVASPVSRLARGLCNPLLSCRPDCCVGAPALI